ncbi:uncharacterized protein [Nicotiana tomentosiformis]|uniref:uncharacterized protein n=1 Tax=Nicotiana tomentosiformis TaxID=4098 RepID=UPI00388C7401
MNQVAKHQEFGLHTKCKSLRLNHLCFADNVLLFSRRNFQSVLLMLRGLKTFSNASGLCTNASKSNIFSVSMQPQCEADLLELTGYAKGTLPFRYLGVPISARKLSKMDCEILIERLTSVLKGISAICKNFLWDGKMITNRPPLVAWELVLFGGNMSHHLTVVGTEKRQIYGEQWLQLENGGAGELALVEMDMEQRKYDKIQFHLLVGDA